MPWAAIGSAVIGGMFQSNAASKAAGAQQAADAARLEEEKRVREQLRLDTETQRAVADQAFADYNAGLISYAEAQQKAAQAMGQVQSSIGQSQLSDTAKAMEMAKFQPYSIRTGTGSTFFDQGTGQAGFALAPETYGYQQDLYKKAGEAAGAIQATPEQAAAQYVAQQQGLLQPGRQAEDIALRNQQLSRGRIGMGISGEAAGAGAGGMVNPEQFSRDRARALADAQIAAQGTQAGQAQQANQLALATGLFSGGMAPEQFGLNALTQGSNIGSLAQGAGQAQANIYGSGMSNVYNSMLGAAGTAQQAAQYLPQANLTGAQEAYNRQQTYLGSLQGNQLPYQAMTMPQATVPGSAYAMAGLGSGLMNAGMQGVNRLINPVQQTVPYTPTYGGTQRQITPQTQSNLNYFQGFGQGYDS
jgi:hypothetical protein